MDKIEYRDTVDKSQWTHGLWSDEPDKIQWQDNLTGLPCLIVRGPVGALCGYVGVPKGHGWHGLDYGQCPKGESCPERSSERSWCDHTPEHLLNVHGGVTFAGKCSDVSVEKWASWRKNMLARRAEAEKFPKGDSAETLREWGPYLDNYEAWLEKAHARFICHIPAPGDPDDIWWFGFDCAHSGDICPKMNRYGVRAMMGHFGEVYRDIPYVTEQCVGLARQLKEVERAPPAHTE